MPLHRVIRTMKDGTRTEVIEYSKTTQYSMVPPKELFSQLVQCFRYEVKTDINPSIVTLNGKRVIVPTWQEVHPQTTLDDIEWVKPQRRPRADISVKTGDGKYKTTFNTATGNFKCSCMGFWRSNGNCKHVKELRESLQG